MSTSTFANTGEEILTKNLNVESSFDVSEDDVDTLFELSKCIQWINKGNYNKVGLQFPDELLVNAPSVARHMRDQLGRQVYVLADTTFASCCVDEVAAQHVGADAIIHFGRCCLTPSEQLPVLYILAPYLNVDLERISSNAIDTIDKTSQAILFYDTRCYLHSEKIFHHLVNILPNLIHSQLLIPGYEEESNIEENLTVHNINGRIIKLPSEKNISDYNFLFIGPQTSTLTCLAMKFPQNKFYQIDPSSGEVETIIMTKNVMKRSAKLEQIKDANIIGILMGTLGKAKYLDIVKQLKKIIKSRGKRAYTFVVGKPNEAKLANIPEVDVYVYISCPETSIVDRSFDPALYKKLVTPWEVELALNPSREWTLSFETDFSELLENGNNFCKFHEDRIETEVSVSLLTNKTQSLGISENSSLSGNCDAVAIKPEGVITTIHQGGGGELLSQRSWTGLDPSEPSQFPLKAVKGRDGIASVYTDES